MSRILPRTKFHSSTLIRCLADLDMADAVDPGNDFAEKLGQWIHFADAIGLSAIHSGSIASEATMQADAKADACAAASVEFERIKTLLTNSIIKSCSPKAGKTHISLPAPDFDLPMNFATAFVPYRRFYEAHQHDMEMSIEPLRVNVRDAVAKASPRLKKLAELDAAHEKILRDRERQLLAKVPLLLRKRFEHLYKEHQQKISDNGQADKPADWMLAGGWLARFCNDMQMLLQAELDLRLQPTTGLIEAFKNEPQ
jgi:hypothetical protein